MSDSRVLVEDFEKSEYYRMCKDGSLDELKLPGEHFLAETYRRWKDEQKAKGSLTGWL